MINQNLNNPKIHSAAAGYLNFAFCTLYFEFSPINSLSAKLYKELN